MANLIDVLIDIGRGGVRQQAEDGSLPAGHNGVYRDLETPVRNTSHWLIIFIKLYECTQDDAFLRAATQAQSYLLSPAARPMRGAFWHRTNPEKDFCNGLVGQAWTIEALATFAQVTGESAPVDLAQEVFNSHPFDEVTGIWRRLSVDGSYLSYDITFNHQLWFAAAGALLAQWDQTAGQSTKRFLDRLQHNFSIYPSGLVFHRLLVPELLGPKAKIRMLWMKRRRDATHNKAVGYHSFNTYGFALLKSVYPQHSFWHSDRLQRSLVYLKSDEYVRSLDDNKYAYPYNPPGFEIPYSIFGLQSLNESDLIRTSQRWVQEQFARHFNWKTLRMDRRSPDAATQTARLYELLRMPQTVLERIVLNT